MITNVILHNCATKEIVILGREARYLTIKKEKL